MPSSLLREAPAPASMIKQAWRVTGVVVLATLCVSLGALLLRALAGPSFVDELTVANPTEFTVHVRVSDDGDSWLGLGNVGSNEERTFRSVVDQGEGWVFEFSYAGEVAGHLEVRRDSLSEGGWRVEVPASVGPHLAEQGFTPPPPGF